MLSIRMPNRLHRYYGAGYLHFITTSCYQRLPLLGTRPNRDLFLQVRGLDNFGARYDSSSLGRFMTADWAARPTECMNTGDIENMKKRGVYTTTCTTHNPPSRLTRL